MIREILDYLEDILESINNIERFVEGMDFNDFKKDEKTIYAVIRALEIIGEAVKNIPEEIKKKYPEIPWKNMAGMRDKLIHEYFGVNKRVVWDAIKEELPNIKPLFEKILKDFK